MTFTKLFSSITESTVWCESSDVRVVWIAMLAMADRNGCVYASIPGLANRARVPLELTEQALAKFQLPDPYSRTSEFEGRRIEPIDGGWRLLNYLKYRKVRDEEAAKESKRNYINTRRIEERRAACEAISPEIPSVDEVVAYGALHGCSEDLCRRFHKWNDERWTWANEHGKLIDWKKCLVRWREKERAGPKRTTAAGNGQLSVADRITLEKSIDIHKERIAAHPANRESLAAIDHISTVAEKAELKLLRESLRGLENRLAGIPTTP